MSLTQQQLKLDINQSPEVLERVLRVTRHRGFSVDLIDWNSATSELFLTVSSERNVSLLTSQLIKLFDVKSVLDVTDIKQSKTA